MPGSQNGGPRPRPVKAETIHDLARAGDLAGVERKLLENPSLLNDKNPVVRAVFVLLFLIKKMRSLGRFHDSMLASWVSVLDSLGTDLFSFNV
jgi:hypothetical protein